MRRSNGDQKLEEKESCKLGKFKAHRCGQTAEPFYHRDSALPETTVAAHQQRIREIKAQQEEAKAHSARLPVAAAVVWPRQVRAMTVIVPQTTAAAKGGRACRGQGARSSSLRVEQERMNYGTRKAALSNFNVEQSQLDVDGVPFATGGNGSIHPSGKVPRNCSGYQVSQRGFAGVVQEGGADVV